MFESRGPIHLLHLLQHSSDSAIAIHGGQTAFQGRQGYLAHGRVALATALGPQAHRMLLPSLQQLAGCHTDAAG